jgi:zinc and cadmium transporter
LILSNIVLATIIGGLISMAAAAWLSMTVLAKLTPKLVSLSAGLLLGTAILHLMPEAFESKVNMHSLTWTLLLGLVGFFLLEKVAILRHNHHHEGDGHHHDHGHDHHEARSGGMLILVGDAVHNFADGILIAAAFLADVRLGWITTAAIAAHEIPQEIGDFIVLLNAGYSRRRAFLFNALVSLSAVLGGVIGFYALAQSKDYLPYVLMLACSSFIYIALADLVPDMQRTRSAGSNWLQLTLMLSGIAIIAILTAQMHSH